jgi:hypothetical protein
MLNRVLVGLGTLVGLLMGFTTMVPDTVGPLLLVIIGIVYSVMNTDAEDATGSLVLAIAVGGMAMSDVLHHIPAVGMQLNTAMGALSMALWAGVATVAATRVFNRIKG